MLGMGLASTFWGLVSEGKKNPSSKITSCTQEPIFFFMLNPFYFSFSLACIFRGNVSFNTLIKGDITWKYSPILSLPP